MRRGWARVAAAAGGLLLLASLYLQWGAVGPCDSYGCGPGGVAWASPGTLAALAAVAVVAASVPALGRPETAWLLAPCALLAAYLVVGVGLATRSTLLFGEEHTAGARYHP